MRLKIIDDTVAGKRLAKAGEVIDVADSEARLLIGYGKAEKFIEHTPQPSAPQPAKVETGQAPAKTETSTTEVAAAAARATEELDPPPDEKKSRRGTTK